MSHYDAEAYGRLAHAISLDMLNRIQSLRRRKLTMQTFTVTVKIVPANKATPNVASTHVCYAPDVHALSRFFIDGMSDFEGPPGTPNPAIIERVTDPTPEKVD